jgi:hypothetical protein
VRVSGLERRLQLGVMLCVCILATGCRHRTKTAPAPLPPPAAVALVQAPESATPPQVQSVPIAPLPVPTLQPPPKKKRRKPAVVPAAPPAVEVATNTTPPPPVNVVGTLTSGGDAAPQAEQKARASIGEVEKQLAGLSAATLDSQKTAVARVKTFLRQAHEALKSGDAEGASTLAAKARVLLDDLSR